VDKRFGERDGLSEAEKTNVRFHQERLRQSRNMFSIEQEESALTHLGMRLGDSAPGANPLQDDLFFQVGEDEEFGGKGGLLDEQAVQALHFGGGGDDAGNPERKKSKREIMDEIVAKSKMHKAERRQENQEQMELLQEVDSKFKEITHFLTLKPKPEKKEKKAAKEADEPVGREHEEGYVPDEYDLLVNELRTTSRDAKAGDRMQSKEEEAKLRLERLKTLELMRERRMQGISVGPEVEDGAEGTTKKAKLELTELKKRVAAGKAAFEEGGEDEADEENVDDDDDDDDEEDGGAAEDGKGKKSNRKLKRRLRAKLRGELSKEMRNRGDWVIQKRWKRDLLDDELQALKDESASHQVVVDANTGEEFPFVIPVPNSFEEFVALMRGNTTEVCGAVLDRMLHSNDPLLDPANAAKLRQLHIFILGWALRGAGSEDCGRLDRHMHDWIEMGVNAIRRLVLMVPLPEQDVLTSPISVFFAYRVLLNAVTGVEPVVPAKAASEHEMFVPLLPRLENAGRRRGAEARGAGRVSYLVDGFPGVPVLLTLTHLSRLFSASDKMHPIWSPVLTHLLGVISSQPARSFSHLQILTMVSEALVPVLADARVFAPEPVALASSLSRVVAGQSPALHPHWPSLKLSDEERTWLSAASVRLASACGALVGQGSDAVIRLLEAVLRDGNGSAAQLEALAALAGPLPPLRLREQRVKELETAAPKLFLTGDFGYNGRHDPDAERRQAKLLLRKVKQEKRGAMRELRRDREFINSLKQEEFKEETSERNASLKTIKSFLQAGQAEMKQEEKQKKRAKEKFKL
jgi:hypothetical protein